MKFEIQGQILGTATLCARCPGALRRKVRTDAIHVLQFLPALGLNLRHLQPGRRFFQVVRSSERHGMRPILYCRSRLNLCDTHDARLQPDSTTPSQLGSLHPTSRSNAICFGNLILRLLPPQLLFLEPVQPLQAAFAHCVKEGCLLIQSCVSISKGSQTARADLRFSPNTVVRTPLRGAV